MNKRFAFLLLCMVAGLALGIGAFSVAARIAVYRSSMNPEEEVATVPVISDAQGEAIFRLSADGQTLHYRVIVSDIDNVTQSHIHLAPAGSNGGVVVWLYPAAPPAVLIPGTTNGILMEGTITEDNLVGALLNQPLSVLVAAMEAGNTYVNVHTSANQPGEIRGQIR